MSWQGGLAFWLCVFGLLMKEAMLLKSCMTCSRGADVDARNDRGNTALHTAISFHGQS